MILGGTFVALATAGIVLVLFTSWEAQPKPTDGHQAAVSPSRDAAAPELATNSAFQRTTSHSAPPVDTKIGSIIDQQLPPARYKDGEIALVASLSQQIWVRQDEAMATWPTFQEARPALLAELEKEKALVELSVDALMRKAEEFRQAFWDAGGNESPDAYREVYKARIFLEVAHEKNTTDDVVVNELVETIQAAHPLVTNVHGKPTINHEAVDTLLSLRREQFDRHRREINEGRSPTGDDFVTAFDLASLAGYSKDRDFELAERTADWLLAHSNAGGWNKYDDLVSSLKRNSRRGSLFGGNIYVSESSTQEFAKYGRRSPSFTGPDVEARNVQLWGLTNLPPDVTLYQEAMEQ
jgi:hypothetical protein